ncbi:hypothetical protein [Alkalinema sp. FACHB-956]|uniref:hypothetical protein n=1 Tax=Alkalinema sp. FACHB-956 TaxID=2692768 RepID=UPI001689996F|nr:hypothetical protein [Alkalinema sp. FACHB-956]MBD2325967.1 hypothetical protein [Alkalinema sp. FACHB-956]
MTSYIDTVLILGESVEAAVIFNQLSACFKESNVQFLTDTLVVFNDLNDQDKESEVVSSENQAIKKLLAWPVLGGIEYAFSRCKLSVFFWGIRNYYVDAITISLTTSSYLKDSQMQINYNQLIHKIHQSLQAKRTVSDYELLSPNSFWLEELHRIRNNIFEGQYRLDLR